MSGETSRGGPSAQPLPQSLPKRPRSAPPAPRLRAEAAEVPGEEDAAEDTLCPEALARVMVAIHRGSAQARLTEPDDTDGRHTPRPGPGAA